MTGRESCPLPRILHILPHRGGGGETVVDMVSTLEGYVHTRCYLARARTPLKAAPSLVLGLGHLRRAADDADLVHVIGDTASLLCLPLLRSDTIVWGTHGLSLLRRLNGIPRRLAGRRLCATVAAARLTVCSSRSELNELTAITGPVLSERLVEVANGVPMRPLPSVAERASARARLGLSDDELVALYLGELGPHKRPLVAADAVLEAVSRGARVVLLVAGEGPLAGALAARAGPVVRPLGFCNDPAQLLAAADVLVMPSTGEGMSLALLEAMAAGLAIVASDSPGQPEVLGDAGILHPVDDEVALATALVELAAYPDMRARFGAAARARAEAHFTAERFLDDMRTVFETALVG